MCKNNVDFAYIPIRRRMSTKFDNIHRCDLFDLHQQLYEVYGFDEANPGSMILDYLRMTILVRYLNNDYKLARFYIFYDDRIQIAYSTKGYDDAHELFLNITGAIFSFLKSKEAEDLSKDDRENITRIANRFNNFIKEQSEFEKMGFRKVENENKFFADIGELRIGIIPVNEEEFPCYFNIEFLSYSSRRREPHRRDIAHHWGFEDPSNHTGKSYYEDHKVNSKEELFTKIHKRIEMLNSCPDGQNIDYMWKAMSILENQKLGIQL